MWRHEWGVVCVNASLDLATLEGATGFRLDGVDFGDSSGSSVASAGDVNGAASGRG